MEWTSLRGISQHGFLILMFFSCLIRIARGSIICMCNTQECRDQKKDSCIAEHYCYVEFVNTEGNRYLPQTRGCIDEPTPLNCERFLPQPNMFLRTHCCSGRLCNDGNTMPKLPTRKRIARPKSATQKRRKKPITPSPHAVDVNYNPNKPSMWRPPMNPMHIAGPIAAACIVLSMIIFVIFLIKRKESQESTDNLVYTDYDPALLAALANQPDRDETVTPVLNPVLYNPFLKINKSPV